MERRVEYAKKTMKNDILCIIFTDECRATLDGPDGWSKGWLANDQPMSTRLKRIQGGGGVMFWSGIVGDKLIGPFKVPERVKITSKKYILSFSRRTLYFGTKHSHLN